MTPIPSLSPQARAELEAWEERRLTAEEFLARVNAPWTEREREDFEALHAWFVRRYPTPVDRLRAARHLAEQWRRTSASDPSARP
jgi:hypothetical protein